MTTILSRTAIRPTRAVAPSFAATVNATGLSPARGMLLVTVTHGASDTADQTHRSCVAPPHVLGTLCCTTLKVPDVAAAVKLNAVWLTPYWQPACAMRIFCPAVGVGHRIIAMPSRGAS